MMFGIGIRRVVSGTLVALFFSGLGTAVLADDDEFDAAALARVLPLATVSLSQGLTASQSWGQPISAKYEIQNGALRLSVYTKSDDKFFEVIVDSSSGAIAKAKAITERGDLKDARTQSRVVAKAKMPLLRAVEDAIAAHQGYRAVRVVPVMMVVVPVAVITLMKEETTQDVMIKLD